MRQVCITIDVDTLHHYRFLAPAGQVNDDPILPHILPRILDSLDELGIRATLFVVGTTVAGYKALWRRADASGHELASHSLNHEQAFHRLSPAQKCAEVTASKRLIEDCVGREVVGFRAPAYNLDSELLEALVAAGYRYDSSLFPGWYVPLGKLVLRLLSTQRGAAAMSGVYWRHWWLPRDPFRWAIGSASLVEVPLATSRLAFPFMGTLHLLLPRWFFELQVSYFESRQRPVVYELHPTELMDPKAVEDATWLRRIPGVGRNADPWRLFHYRLARLRSLGEVRLLRELDVGNAPTVHLVR